MTESPPIVAFSGGKDSTAMVLYMHLSGRRGILLFTPTGNEPPEVMSHIQAIALLVGWPLIMPPAPTLLELINHFNALPNFQMRWCTRMIKITPCAAYLQQHPGSILCVGLRSDEPGRQGLYGDFAKYSYPLRDAGFDLSRTEQFLKAQKVNVPKRTNCMWCWAQRLAQWYDLLQDYPDAYAEGEALEKRIGHTFRSDARDTWPASMTDLRIEFERGRKVPRRDNNEHGACRVCSL